jgi:prolyl-tRNA synthetase
VPQDAEIRSHQLLLRAGFIRKLSSGIYSFLPLGVRVLRNVERVVREEMDRAGALEVFMPALQPKELWEAGPRWDAAKQVMFAVNSAGTAPHHKFELVLGPTHEEVITSLVAANINSYRQLPRTFYQIQTKFRDEIRPRFGLLRAKEFIMKDGYSFDLDDVGADKSYEKMYAAYQKIFDRCGLKYRIVEADTGVMGGSRSQEFQVPCEAGESDVVYTESGNYSASIEKAQSRAKPRGKGTLLGKPEKFATPGVKSIEDLEKKPYGIAASDQIKTLVYLCDTKLYLFLLRGDHQLNEVKVGQLGFSEFRAASDNEIAAALGAHPGSLGAVGVSPQSSPKVAGVIADEALKDQEGMTTGANEDGFHWKGVSLKRDIAVTRWADLRLAQAGEQAPNSDEQLKIERAIEVGHVFKLGTKYSQKMGAAVLDEQGKSRPCVMGCYGIGVTRTLQAVAEQCSDKDGMIWPEALAPFRVLVQLLETKDAEAVQAAENLYRELKDAGVEVLYDDRDERPGVKFKDGDLLGIPCQVRIGKAFKEKKLLEVKIRKTGETQQIKPSELRQLFS